jgi:hypothetical protein
VDAISSGASSARVATQQLGAGAAGQESSTVAQLHLQTLGVVRHHALDVVEIDDVRTMQPQKLTWRQLGREIGDARRDEVAAFAREDGDVVVLGFRERRM